MNLRSCAKRFGGLAFMYQALSTCLIVYIQKSDFHLIPVFCVVIVVKNVPCLAQVVFSCFVLHSSKRLLVLTTKVTHLCSQMEFIVQLEESI